MKEEFSIYDSPFSEETKKLRRNALLSSGVCLFIGMSGEIPEKLFLLGVGSPEQKELIGYFLFSISLYLFIHFISAASVELARWIRPFYVRVIKKRTLLKLPGFDETDWIKFLEDIDDQDLDRVAEKVEHESEIFVDKKLRYLFNQIYLKLIIEIIFPMVIGLFGLVYLGKLVFC